MKLLTNVWRAAAAIGCLLFLSSVMESSLGAPPAQCIRIMEQDSTRNNLVDPPGYATGRLGSLGDVRITGRGKQSIILVAGLGFGSHVFQALIQKLEPDFTVYAVTLPGCAGTAAPPSPPLSASFGLQDWTNSALKGIERLMTEERIEKPIVIGHWLTGTQVALRLALKHQKEIRGVILFTPVLRFLPTDTAVSRYYATVEGRRRSVDGYLAPKWFRTVTRETWDDNNFLPGDYAVNPVLGLRLWREAARPPLHVWIRYLCEVYAQDLTPDLDSLNIPTLMLNPGYEGIWHDGANYMTESFGEQTWPESVRKNTHITAVTIPNARCCLWLDQPEETIRVMHAFLEKL